MQGVSTEGFFYLQYWKELKKEKKIVVSKKMCLRVSTVLFKQIGGISFYTHK